MFEKTYDVVVAGAGVAGVAAALECARAGLHTALVEKTVLLGGLATTGLVNIYLPLCDGYGHQAIFGIAEELLHLSLRYGPGNVPEAWLREKCQEPVTGPRYMTAFSPASFVLALDEALLDAGVTIWLDTLVSEPAMAPGRRIVGLEVENKSGRGVLRAYRDRCHRRCRRGLSRRRTLHRGGQLAVACTGGVTRACPRRGREPGTRIPSGRGPCRRRRQRAQLPDRAVPEVRRRLAMETYCARWSRRQRERTTAGRTAPYHAENAFLHRYLAEVKFALRDVIEHRKPTTNSPQRPPPSIIVLGLRRRPVRPEACEAWPPAAQDRWRRRFADAQRGSLAPTSCCPH